VALGRYACQFICQPIIPARRGRRCDCSARIRLHPQPLIGRNLGELAKAIQYTAHLALTVLGGNCFRNLQIYSSNLICQGNLHTESLDANKVSLPTIPYTFQHIPIHTGAKLGSSYGLPHSMLSIPRQKVETGVVHHSYHLCRADSALNKPAWAKRSLANRAHTKEPRYGL